MSQHTPGPWKACFPVGNPPFVGDEGTVIIQKVGPLGNRPIAQANARLIAAAPTMLNALRAIVKLLDGSRAKDIPGALMVAVTAIAEATEEQP